ncbi:MAG: 30S ribosomal protein S16 [Acidobacteria bacterium]|nr:30S ribosomal protein S16 [Acidobacteriota bacterium]
MLLRIRLSRHGAKKNPHYRVVVTEKRSPRDGRFLELVGYYNPAKKPVLLNLELDRIDYWIQKGAQPSDTVKSLVEKVRKSAPEPAIAGQ